MTNCIKCDGTKKIMGIGMMKESCKACKGTGIASIEKLADEVADEFLKDVKNEKKLKGITDGKKV
jgi:DnaJ-class molecular chaperone